ncbi:MAG: apolipoprotein N-acyltransferase [Acidobacteria bacterium 13_1_20CM_2_65_9]|nr:MAG: apolipoprotein N-acyltransferase [Acidobacteria bacterium 13_1_20CM_2_65_9]
MPRRSFDYALASTSGVLLALSFPKFGHPALAWIALTPLLVALAGASVRQSFALGLLTGIVYFTGTLYWITRVMAVYGDLQWWVAVLINALLVAYLALFPAIFALIVRRIVVAHGPAAVMAAPLVWVTAELGRTYFLTGFPWVLLGYSQSPVLPIAQLASVFGVYGVSMLVAAVSAALALIAVGPPKAGPYVPLGRYVPLCVVLLALAVVAVWGSRRAAGREWTHTGDPIRVGLIQGNVDQGQKWDPARASAIFHEYLRMTREAIAQGAQFVLWPESSTPFYFEEDRPGAEMVRAIARDARVTILFGSDQVDWRVEGNKRIPDKYYNSAFVVRPDGTTAGAYRKMHLVPFGEYVPLKELLFFAAPLVEAVGPFSAGVDPTLLPVNGHPVSVAICYEVVYPNLIRQFVVRGSELLTTITNDAWFGSTSAPYQHFAQASMRAIEEGRYLVRSANTGISGIVDPYGHVVAETRIFEPAVVVGEARFLRHSTFYARHGDIVAYASAVMTLALVVVSRRRVQ